MHNPFTRSFALCSDIAAACLCLQRSADIAQFQPARSSLRPDGSRRSLLQHKMSAPGLAEEATGDIGGPDVSDAGAGECAAFNDAEVEIARAGMRPHSVADVPHLQVAGPR